MITLAPRPDPDEDCEPKPRLADSEGGAPVYQQIPTASMRLIKMQEYLGMCHDFIHKYKPLTSFHIVILGAVCGSVG